jgi:hypothetical protein
VHIIEVAMAAAITVGVAGTSYAAFNPDGLTERAQTVADQADCRTVDSAVVAYLAERGVAPSMIADVRPYVRGDISAYRIENGLAAGPGCDAITLR